MPVVVVSLQLSWQPRCTGRGGVPPGAGFSRCSCRRSWPRKI